MITCFYNELDNLTVNRYEKSLNYLIVQVQHICLSPYAILLSHSHVTERRARLQICFVYGEVKLKDISGCAGMCCLQLTDGFVIDLQMRG
jgi:hypothetical protein